MRLYGDKESVLKSLVLMTTEVLKDFTFTIQKCVSADSELLVITITKVFKNCIIQNCVSADSER